MGQKKVQQLCGARADTIDFRDRMYEPTLVEVPTRMPLEDYRKLGVPVLDQGAEGACTGYALGTVANFLLRKRKVVPDSKDVSLRMLYELARRYDEWPGEAYEGSSARGAMKGWHKHGVCSRALWPDASNGLALSAARAKDASTRPLGAYFRVNHKDLVAMHTAITETGILYATTAVHEGWEPENVGPDGAIRPSAKILGYHAVAIVGYDETGFWIQNSWGASWGKEGFGHVTYADWLANATDVWVARLGSPVVIQGGAAATSGLAGTPKSAVSYQELRPHVVSLGNDGELRPIGRYASTPKDIDEILDHDFPTAARSWDRKRLVLYAHGGLVGGSTALEHANDYRQAVSYGAYPVSFIWHTDALSTVTNIVQDAMRRRRPEGALTSAKDFLLDRVDDTIEALARLPGRAMWDEMKENAELATMGAAGGARVFADKLAARMRQDPSIEVHLVGHSAGSILLARLVEYLTTDGPLTGPGWAPGSRGHGLKIESVALWAPACTTKLFESAYQPAVESGRIGRLRVYTLTDPVERDDDCAGIYNKSLLYLVSHAFEETPHVPFLHAGEPILGMEAGIRRAPGVKALLEERDAWVKAGGDSPLSTAQRHGQFDDDHPTKKSTLEFIFGRPVEERRIPIAVPTAVLRERRVAIQARMG